MSQDATAGSHPLSVAAPESGLDACQVAARKVAQRLLVSPVTEVVMNSKKKSKGAPGRAGKRRIAHEAEGGASGALAGAVLGAGAGPPGMVAGAIIGGVAGAITGAVLDSESSRQASRTRKLDAEIGVSEGDLGAPNLVHPPAKVGAYSTASAGADLSSGDEPAEGPMQTPEG